MSDCCDKHSEVRHAICPLCGTQADAVGITTLYHQLHQPWQYAPFQGDYYFCAEQGCEEVYFNEDGQHFSANALRYPVGQKTKDPEHQLCYCFDIRYSDIQSPEGAARSREFVVNETRHGRCACEARNPSGRCCLRDFPAPQ